MPGNRAAAFALKSMMDDLTGCRVLVVEDEGLIALALEDLLEGFGCPIIGPVASLAEAVALARSAEIDGALLDVNVRGQLIYPAAEILRERGIPVIFCTGYSDTAIVPDAFANSPHLFKPYDEASLRRVMDVVFTGRIGSEPR
jgi:CheY-like chemotaxis protein